LGLLILDLVSFVDNQIFPLEFHYLGHAEPNTLKSGQNYVKLARLHLIFEDVLSFCLGGNQIEHPNFRAPLFELFLPVRNNCLGNNDYEVVLDFLELSEECEE